MPALGPFGYPPPHEYGTPICEPPRRITYSMACGPRTRPGATPALVPARPRLLRNCRPRVHGDLGGQRCGLRSRRSRSRGVTRRARADDLRQRRIPLPVIGSGRTRSGLSTPRRPARARPRQSPEQVLVTSGIACPAKYFPAISIRCSGRRTVSYRWYARARPSPPTRCRGPPPSGRRRGRASRAGCLPARRR